MEAVLRLMRIPVLLLAVAAILTGCGLFGGAAQERQNENEALTQGVDFGRIVTAQGIGQDNAPLEETNSFSASQDFIYVVAEADYIEEGTTLFARWFREGEPLEDSTALTADRDYQDTYVEFHLENLQNSFQTGDYSVQLFVNGNPAETVDFRIE